MFKLEHTNKNGTFKIVLKREISNREMHDLMQLASNLVPCDDPVPNATAAMGYPGPYSTEHINSGRIYGPHLPAGHRSGQTLEHASVLAHIDNAKDGKPVQTKLGQYPVDHIEMGAYEEPDDGVRLKFVAFPFTQKVAIFKLLREATGISLFGCKEIAYGNYPCPKLIPATAQFILEEMKKLQPPVFARIVPGDAV